MQKNTKLKNISQFCKLFHDKTKMRRTYNDKKHKHIAQNELQKTFKTQKSCYNHVLVGMFLVVHVTFTRKFLYL